MTNKNDLKYIAHYTSTMPEKLLAINREIGDYFYYKGYKMNIIRIVGTHMLIKGDIGQFCYPLYARETKSRVTKNGLL